MTHYEQNIYAFYKKEKLKRTILIALLSGGFLLLALIFLASLLEMVFNFSTNTRWLLLFGAILLPLLSIFSFLFIKYVGGFTYNPQALAKQIGNLIPSIKDTLLNLIQIRETYGDDNPFVKRELSIVNNISNHHQFDRLVNFNREKSLAKKVGIAYIVAILIMAITPLSNSLARVIFFGRNYERPLPYAIESITKDIELSKGEDAFVVFNVHLLDTLQNNALPSRLMLRIVDKDGFLLPDITVYKDSSGLFSHKLNGQKETITYYATSLDGSRVIKSDVHKIDVFDRPDVKMFQVSIYPPSYSGKPSLSLDENFGDATVLRGSTIKLKLKATKLLGSASILTLPDSTRIPMEVSEGSASTSFRVMKDEAYRLVISDRDGLFNKSEAIYRLNCVSDEAPSIRVVEPHLPELELGETLREGLHVDIQDDYGFSTLNLKYRLSGSLYAIIDTTFQSISLPLEGANKNEDKSIAKSVFYEWDLGKLGIVEGDVVEFYFEVFDNDNVLGNKSAKSDFYHFRVPTLEELFKSADNNEKDVLSTIDEKVKQTEALQKEIERVQDELKQKNAADWQDKKAISQLVEKQQQIQSQLGKTAEQIEQMVTEMKEQQLLSPEIMEKYMEVQDLLKNVNIPEFTQEMNKLKEKLNNISDQDVRQTMKNMEFNEEQFKNKLERVKELVMRTQLERKFDELSKRLSSMSEKQNEIHEQIKKEDNKNNPSEEKKDELSRKQDLLEKEMKSFEDALKETKKKMDEFPRGDKLPKEDLKKFDEQMKQDAVNQNMKEAKQNIQKGDLQSAQKNTKQAADKMKEQAKALDDIKDSFRQMQKKEAIESLRKSIQMALNLSGAQEELQEKLKQQSSKGRLSKEEAQGHAVDQKDILESLENLKKSMDKANKRMSSLPTTASSMLSAAEKQMKDALDKLDMQNPSESKNNMEGAMHAMNEFAGMANDILESLMSDKGGKNGGQGGEGGLDGIADGQQKINNQTSDALSNLFGNGGGSQADQEGRLKQLAAQQRMLQQQLNAYKNSQLSKGNENMSSMLEKVAEEMETVAQTLERQGNSRDVVTRQREILSRLLNASRSLRKQEQDEKREAETAKQYNKLPSPEEVKRQHLSKLQDAISKIKQYGYSDSYEKLIRSYYKKLERKSIDPM